MIPTIDELQPHTGRIIAEGGTIKNIADSLTDEGVISLEFLHNLVHLGEIFMVDTTKLAVADNGYFRIRIRTGTRRLHFGIDWKGEFKTRFKTYYAPTILTAGTPYTPFNRKPDSSVTLGATVFLDPTFSGGALRGNQFVGSGGNVQTRAGGDVGAGLESDFPPNTEFIIELQNVGGAVADLCVIIAMYEDDI